MRLILVTLSLAAFSLAQSGRTYNSVGGFGNVIYPGTGHAPNAPVGPPPRVGYAPSRGNGYAGRPPVANHPSHGRTAVVPYPVIVGGYGYGGYPPGYGYSEAPQAAYGDPQQQVMTTSSAPSVVINQTFIPPQAVPMMRDYPQPDQPQGPQSGGMHMYEGLRTQQQPRASDQPTLYLIAFKDHHIVPALGYWLEDGNLHYVSAEHTLNQASLDLIDRELSQQLNDERNVEFRLPRAQ